MTPAQWSAIILSWKPIFWRETDQQLPPSAIIGMPEYRLRLPSIVLTTPPIAIALWLNLAMTAFLGPLDITAEANKMTVGLDPIVLLKLVVSGCAAVLGAYGVIASADVRDAILTPPPLMLFGILFLAVLATPIAISTASLPTTLINFTHVMFLVTALITLRLPGVATAALAGIFATFCLAMFMWFFVPKYGEFPELLADGLIVVRLSGTAHPNAVGRAMVLGILLTLYLNRIGQFRLPLTMTLTACFGYAAYLAWSRTAIVAGAVGMVILFLDRIVTRVGIAGVVLLGLIALAGLSSIYVLGYEDEIVGELLVKVSKTGDADEITSGTGRADIWSRAFELIAERPMIGHGFNAAPSLMIDHSQATHNAVLHATLATGWLGGGLMLSLLMWNLYLVLRCDSLLVRSLSAFTVMSCLTEDTILETFPGPCTIMWLITIIAPMTQLSSNQVSSSHLDVGRLETARQGAVAMPTQ
ncbi:MAG: O-antigen ligase family protein [Planctomycetota bacterium]